MLLIKPRIVILQSTGSQVTPGFPHSQIRLRVASPKVREHGRTTPVAYELASNTYYGLGVVTQMLLFVSSKFQKIQNPGSRLRGQRVCRRWSVQSGEYHRDVVSLLVSEEYQHPIIFHQVEWDLWHHSNCPLQILLLPLVLPTLSVNQNDELY